MLNWAFMLKFPKMDSNNHSVESRRTSGYNCIAWAYGVDTENMWPAMAEDGYWWPEGVLNENSIDAFVDLFRSIGYEVCRDGSYEHNFKKVCIYANEEGPQHASFQLDGDMWASKMGALEDIWHDDPDVVSGFYGSPVVYMRKRRAT